MSASGPSRSLPPGNTRYPLYRRLGAPQGRSGQVGKILPPPGFDPRTVQSVSSRYTDYATRPTSLVFRRSNYVRLSESLLNVILFQTDNFLFLHDYKNAFKTQHSRWLGYRPTAASHSKGTLNGLMGNEKNITKRMKIKKIVQFCKRFCCTTEQVNNWTKACERNGANNMKKIGQERAKRI